MLINVMNEYIHHFCNFSHWLYIHQKMYLTSVKISKLLIERVNSKNVWFNLKLDFTVS